MPPPLLLCLDLKASFLLVPVNNRVIWFWTGTNTGTTILIQLSVDCHYQPISQG
jgi:hypothetical protein